MHGDSALMCEWEIHDGCHVCKLCGWEYRGRDGKPRTPVGALYRECPVKVRRAALWGWGDHLALFLEACFITKERVAWWLVKLRLASSLEGCKSCDERQKMLNEFGWRCYAAIAKWLR